MIGERLKKLRVERALSQEELATQIGVQKATISRYETNRDNPSDKIKVAIAIFFDISLDYLLGVIEEPHPYFSQDIFIKLPCRMNQNERLLLSEFIGYIIYKRDA